MAQKEDAAAAATAQPKTKKELDVKKLLTVLFFVADVVFMAAAVLIIIHFSTKQPRPVMTEDSESKALVNRRELTDEDPVLYSFDPFTVNLDGHPRRVVRTTIEMELLNSDGYEEAVGKAPIERDEIVRIFNGKTYEDIETLQGKLELKDQIVTAMNKILKTASVKDVYFTDFVVQR